MQAHIASRAVIVRAFIALLLSWCGAGCAQEVFSGNPGKSEQSLATQPASLDIQRWCDNFEKNINTKIDALSDAAINAALSKGTATMSTTEAVTPDTVRGNLHRFFGEDLKTYLNDVCKLLPDDVSRMAVAENISSRSAPSIIFIDGELNEAKMSVRNNTLILNSLMLRLPYEEWRHILSHEMTHYLVQGDNISTFQYRFVMEGLTEVIASDVSATEKWGGKVHYPDEVKLMRALFGLNCKAALFDWYTSSEDWDRHQFVEAVSNSLSAFPEIGDRSTEFASAWIDRWEVRSANEQVYQLKLNFSTLMLMKGAISAEDFKKVKDVADSLQPINQIVRDLASVGLRFKADKTIK
jgi:hypothetical protein